MGIRRRQRGARGAVLSCMSAKAWMALLVPLWTTLSYTIGVYNVWGGGFLFHWGVMDYSGSYVVHLTVGISGYTAAYWVRAPCIIHYLFQEKKNSSFCDVSL